MHMHADHRCLPGMPLNRAMQAAFHALIQVPGLLGEVAWVNGRERWLPHLSLMRHTNKTWLIALHNHLWDSNLLLVSSLPSVHEAYAKGVAPAPAGVASPH